MDKFDIPEPKKIAPQLTPEQRKAMQPVDLLVQYIMPKLWDKVNYLEWAVKAELHSVRESIEFVQRYADKVGADADTNIMRMGDRVSELERRLDSLMEVNQKLSSVEKPKRTRRKKADIPPVETPAKPLESDPRGVMIEENVSEPVAMADVAVYDAEADMWVPKTIDGVEITAAVVSAVLAGESSYPVSVMTFVYDLSEDRRKVLCAAFPD